MKHTCCLLSLAAGFVSRSNDFATAFQPQRQSTLSSSSLMRSRYTWRSDGRTTSTISLLATMSPEEERAAALSEYLAKAHEEKLRVIKEVEQKKNQEIDQLKQQIAELKSHPTTTTQSSAVVMVNGADAIAVKALDDMNKDELMAKVVQYQNFMRQYMIDAQEEKYRAVQEAQTAAQKKLTESLMLLGLAPATTTISSTTMLSSSTVTASPLYTARNMAVSNAGSQSRWGPMEVERVSSGSTLTTTTPIMNRVVSSTTMSINGGSVPVMNTAPPTQATSTVVVPVPPEVAEADHGLRSDGSIGGLTLAERVYFGSNAAAPTTSVTTTSSNTAVPSSTTSTTNNPMEVLYQKRNIKVVQAAQAGKSNRWGPQEIERASNIVATTTTTSGGSFSNANTATTTTPQRVNFGASILGQQ